jgi:hypothetical protein
MLAVSVIAVIVAASAALGVVAVYRRQRIARRVRMELTNLGNVESRYQVRAEDPENSLEFQFTLHGSRLLPPRVTEPVQTATPATPARQASAQSPYQEPRGVLAAADGAMGAGGAIAGFLGTVGLLLPRSIGAPLLRISGQLRGKQIAVARARSAPTQVARVTRYAPRPLARLRKLVPAGLARRRKPAAAAAPDREPAPAAGFAPSVAAAAAGWLETPPVLPGDTMGIDLLIRSDISHLRQTRSYRVLSRSGDLEDAPLVAEQGSVHFLGNFWTRRFAPYLAILITAALLLLLVFWLASTGVLA